MSLPLGCVSLHSAACGHAAAEAVQLRGGTAAAAAGGVAERVSLARDELEGCVRLAREVGSGYVGS